MKSLATTVFVRLVPVVFLTTAAIVYVVSVEGSNAFPARNTLPMLLVIVLAALTLTKGGGQWTGSGWRWLLGTIGFAVPAIGLSLYLHHGYETDLNGMYSQSVYPNNLFFYLPVYTMFAGAIGFAIGWIIGRNV